MEPQRLFRRAAMNLPAAEHRRRAEAGKLGEAEHRYTALGDAPVVEMVVIRAGRMTEGIIAYDLRDPDGRDLPPRVAGAHVEIVVAREFLRACSPVDPSDRSRYRVGVLCEAGGRGGSMLLQLIFSEGRWLFVSKPSNHLPLVAEATHSLLVGGGIGITPMLAMVHALHTEGRAFALHSSNRTRAEMAFSAEIETAPWAVRAALHASGGAASRSRRDPARPPPAHPVFACGPSPCMAAVMEATERAGYPEEPRHVESFALPDDPTKEDHPFILRQVRSGETIEVPEGRSAAEVLIAHGVRVDLRCGDDLCWGHARPVLSGEVDHRGGVLSKA